jgi:hypothetical protein
MLTRRHVTRLTRFAAGTALAVGLLATLAQPAAASWEQGGAQTPSGATASLRGVACLGANTCLAVGSYADGTGSHPLSEVRAGTTWGIKPTPAPTGSTDAQLNAVSCWQSGDCTAVGQYVNGSGDTFPLAEHWTGAGWGIEATALPTASKTTLMNGVACYLSDCFAVGSRTSGSDTFTLVESWNGSTWSVQTTPNPAGTTDASLSGVSCTSTSACTAVGSYSAGTSTLSLAERWNGTSWSIQATANPTGSPVFAPLSAVSCPTATRCVATGEGISETWTGTSWTLSKLPPLPGNTGGGGDMTGVSCVAATYCVAAGSYYDDAVLNVVAMAWNGVKWFTQSTPLSSSNDESGFSDVACTATNACTAVGSYHDPVDGNRALGEVWTLRWQETYNPSPTGSIGAGLDGVSCVSAKFCMAVGNFQTSSNFQSLAQSWDGSFWTSQATPQPTISYLNGVKCTSTTACVAVGDYLNGSTPVSLSENWDGSGWHMKTTPNPTGSGESILTSVDCSASNACTAVGFYKKANGNQLSLAERWDGSAWSIEPTPNPSGTTIELGSISCASSSSCMAVGYSLTPNYTMFAERWNGTTWTLQTLPVPAGSTATYLAGVACTSGSSCVAVGNYDKSVSVPMVEAWNGSKWSLQAVQTPSGSTGTYLSGVSCAGGACNAVGDYVLGGAAVTLGERQLGNNWSLQESDVPPNSLASSLAADSCYSPGGCMGVGWLNDSSGTEQLLSDLYS